MALPLQAAEEQHSAHPAIYLLADHLDGVLAAGEDLLAARFDLEAYRRDTGSAHQRAALPAFVANLQALERTAVMHALQARQRAREVRGIDPRFGPLVGLFMAGTTSLADAASELGDSTECDFRTGNDTVCYLRGRSMITAEAGGLDGMTALAVCEGFRIAGCVELGPLLDLVSTFASVLEQHYELYAEPSEQALEPGLAPVPPQSEPPPHSPSLQERLLHVSNVLTYSTGPSLGSGDRDAIRDAVQLRP